MNPINDLKTKINSKPVGEKFLSDSHFRAMTIALLSMGCNILYSVLYGVMAYIYSSFWFLTLFAYYLILGLLRLSVAVFGRSRKNIERQMTVCIGLGLIFIAVILAGSVTINFHSSVTVKYDQILMITIATYTFVLAFLALTLRIYDRGKKVKLTDMLMLLPALCACRGGQQPNEVTAGPTPTLNPALPDAMTKLLKAVLDSLRDEYDYILIDCLPSLGLVALNSLVAADSVIIPCHPAYLSTKGLNVLLRTISKTQRVLNPTLKIDGILLTCADIYTKNAKEIMQALRDSTSVRIFDTVIPRSVKVAECSQMGVSIYRHNRTGKVTAAYEDLIDEVLSYGI